MAKDHEQIYDEFKDVVNMTPKELEEWLDTEESKSVGQDSSGDGEATGHKMGGRILELKRKKKADLDDDDYGAMSKVVGYVHRHLKQGGPKDDMEHSPWRYSLKNWGHDPVKD